MNRITTTRPLVSQEHRNEPVVSDVSAVPVRAADPSASARLDDRIRMLATSTAPASTLLIRAIIGAVFLLEGILKFLNPLELGVGRFEKIGIPFPAFFAPFDGFFEVGCGIFLILGLLTRLAAIPMIVDMIVAITTTKFPMLLHEGFWKAAHEARLDFTMLLGCAFLLLAGAGPLSLDYLLMGPGPEEPRLPDRLSAL